MNDYWHSEYTGDGARCGDARCGKMYDLLHPESSVTLGVITPIHDKVTCPYCIAALPSGYGWTDEQKAIMAKEAERHQPSAQAVMPDETPGEEPRVEQLRLEACQWGQGKSHAITASDVLFLVRRLRETREERQNSYLAITEALGSDRIGAGSIIDAIKGLADRNTFLKGRIAEMSEPKRTKLRVLIVEDATKGSDTDYHSEDLVIEVPPQGAPRVVRCRMMPKEDVRIVVKRAWPLSLTGEESELIALAERVAEDATPQHVAEGMTVDGLRAILKCRDYWYEQHGIVRTDLFRSEATVERLREEARQSVKDYRDLQRDLENAREADLKIVLNALNLTDQGESMADLAKIIDERQRIADNAHIEVEQLKTTLGSQVNDARVAENLAVELSARRMIGELHQALGLKDMPSGMDELNAYWPFMLDRVRQLDDKTLESRRMASDMYRALRIGGPETTDVRQLWMQCIEWARAHPTWPELTQALREHPGSTPSSSSEMLRMIESLVRFRDEVVERLELPKAASLGTVAGVLGRLKGADEKAEQVRQQLAEILRVDPLSNLERLVFEVRQLKSGYELLNIDLAQQPRIVPIPVAPQSVLDWIRLIEQVKPAHLTVEEVCVEVLRAKERDRARVDTVKPRPPAPPAPGRRYTHPAQRPRTYTPVLKTPAIDALDLRKTEPEYTETLEQYTNRIGHTVGVHRKEK